ncbi:Uma2 family endonuclease [Spirulina sp. CS-785/01]|uniref:Uma2 family endonuclease n=1 Tax=Spirulina sp. CS-785/01 TaxID=3021716 RepID=UPI002330E3E0|nr:Uma2 family endonuclease [Spirulina sp. CS-785/01]MDB9314727.1 Uma2 family endonuclease [Spirulina sp. CS-785/01]
MTPDPTPTAATPPVTVTQWQPQMPPDNLIFDDGEPLESNRHRIGMNVLIRSLNQAFAHRNDFFSGGNMFIYFSREQVRNQDFRGPDFFAVLNIDGSYPRQGWVVWEEAGRYPDVIVELMSPSTATIDVTEKKDIYEQTFRTPDYFVYDPFNADSLQGWHLDANQTYQPLTPNENGQLWCQQLGLWVGVWQGTIDREFAPWLRFYDQAGNVVPLPEEAAQQQAETAQQQAETAQQQAETAQQQAEAAQQRATELEQTQRNAIPQLLATGMTVEQVAEILSVSAEFVQQIANSNQ